MLPMVLVPRVIKASHNSVISAHLGVKKTLNKIKACFCWYSQKSDVTEWIKQCTRFGARKRPHPVPRSNLNAYFAGAHMDRIATDILGPFPESVNGNKYILVIMDQFTKFVEAYAIPNQTAEVVAHKIVYEFISRYGVPLEIHSDQGSCYQSNLFQEVWT